MIPSGAKRAKAAVLPMWCGLVLLSVLAGAVRLAPAASAREPPPPASAAAPAGHSKAPAQAPAQAPAKAPDIAKIRAEADGGNTEAQIALGVAYRSGQAGVEKDPKQARAWFEKAAAQKHPAALRMLGDMYAKGEGGKKDKKKALESWQ